METSKNEPLKIREGLLGISKKRRTGELNHFDFGSFSRLQLKKEDISKCLRRMIS